MKKFGFISLAIMLMAVTVCYAQDNSNNELKRDLQELLFSGVLGNSFDPNQMGNSFTQMAANVVGPDKAKEVTQKYMNEQLIADFAALMLPYYTATMSAKDVKYLLKQCNTPEGKSAAEHCAILNSPESQAELQSAMMPIMMNALQGLPYEKIEAVDCPESYKRKCLEYIKVTGSSDDMIESLFSAFNGIADQIAGMGDEKKIEEFKTMMNQLKVFMTENMPIIYLNMCYGQLSETDFDFYIELFSSQAGKNYIKGNKAMLKDIMNLSMQMVQKYSVWLQSNRPIIHVQPTTSNEQYPRGVYKLMTITAYDVEQASPFDQYKICTDSVSLTVMVNNGAFQINNNDNEVLNYTGDYSEGEEDKRTKIYNCNEQEFTLKWWSEIKNHRYFPYKSWCIEKYKAGEYSDNASKIFPVIMEQQGVDSQNAFIGEWRILGEMEDLSKVKKQIKDMKGKKSTMNTNGQIIIFTPERMFAVALEQGVGVMLDVAYDNNVSLTFGGSTHHVKWHNDNTLIVEFKTEQDCSYEVYERVTDGRPLISRIADKFIE